MLSELDERNYGADLSFRLYTVKAGSHLANLAIRLRIADWFTFRQANQVRVIFRRLA